MDDSLYNLNDFPPVAKRMRVKVYLHEEVEDLADLIHKMMIRKVRTWKGKEPNKSETDFIGTQCTPGRSRSIEDVYLAARLLDNRVTPEQIFKAITSIYTHDDCGRHNARGLLFPTYCNTVKRQVHNIVNIRTTVTEVRKQLGDLNIKFTKP